MVTSAYPRATPDPRWPVSFVRDHRIELDIVQQLSTSPDLPADFHRRFVLFPTRYAPYIPAELPAQSAGRPNSSGKMRAKTRAIRQVTVIEVAGHLADVVNDLDQAIQLALAEGPRGVVVDLTGSLTHQQRQQQQQQGAELDAVEMLATAGRHVRDWPGIPVGVAHPDPRVRAVLLAHPLGRQLIVTESMFSAISAVLATPTLTVQRRRLAAHPTAPRASRDFVARTLATWGLDSVIPLASQVVGELVTSSAIHAGTDMDLSVVWNLGALRVTVRDHGPALPGQPYSALDLLGHGLPVVAGLSRALGTLPTADGGRVVWAVLEAPRSRPSTKSETLITKPLITMAEPAKQPR